MFENQYADRLRQSFSDQFEPDGSDFIYRKYMKGPPIKVSAAERGGFIESFNRHWTYAMLGLIAAIIVMFAIVLLYIFETNTEPSEWATYAILFVAIAPFLAAQYWAWDAPARALRGRPVLGEARPRAEVKRLMLAKMSYSQLAATVAAFVFVLFRLNRQEDLFSGWHRLWLAAAAWVIVMAAIQAFRKWRFENSGAK